MRTCGPSPGFGVQLGPITLVSNVGSLGATESSKPSYFVTKPTNSPPLLGVHSSRSHSTSLKSIDQRMRPLVCSLIRGGSHSTGLDLYLSHDFMDLSLKRKAPPEDPFAVRPAKLLKWEGPEASTPKVGLQFSLGVISRIMGKEKTVKSGRKVGRLKKARLFDVTVDSVEIDKAVFLDGFISGAIAIVIRDDQGCLMDSMARETALSSAAQGKALAIRLACLMVSSLGLSSVEVEGDNQRVIHLCVSKDAPPWEFCTIIDDI
ncbi:hypothetical protein LOK49_LG15G00353 [Camellia lanceoleosa]|uniref:Uncharacterized protein n=1 Tax=Camellia lanceoleosa TaxID=1840588 RepID=A0ACC0F803_9ERIC|nr:hypothetical protein LOK49_LG15G00353 [Camellia lanceoleosa]